MRSLFNSFLLAVFLGALCWAQEASPIELSARDGNAPGRYEHYKSIVTEYTGDPCTEAVWVIGLRGLSSQGERHEGALSSGGYNDTVVVVRPDKGEALEFPAATHPGQERSPDCPWGVAQIRPGRYLATPFRGPRLAPTWDLLTPEGAASLPAWLDRDGNGVISPEESQLDDYYGTKAKSIQFHDGLDSKTPQSIGGQSLAPAEYARFVAAVGKGTRFHYLLLDANHPFKDEIRDLRTLTSPLSPADDFHFYEKIALGKGVNPGFRQLVVVLRGMDPAGRRHDSEDNMGPYNDTFLVLSRYDDGSESTVAFRGSSHAGQASTSLSPGCYAGIAQLRPGLYFARSNDIYHGYWSWHVVNSDGDYDGDVPAWRDRDKDGWISEGERRAAERSGVTASEILIHNGIDDDTGNSIGCITMPPAVYGQFVDQLGEGSSFPLLLLDANAPQNP